MLFNSLQFALFFPIVTALYFALPHRHRWWLLLTASCVFYIALIPVYILILAFTIVVDYAAGILIEGAEGRRRRWYLVASIVSNVGVLAVFKYWNFLDTNVGVVAHALGVPWAIPLLSLALPVGLSFHTFQAMSYTIEVYRGRHPAVRHFGIYALYVMFYPQLVAGPIERPQNLIHQFYERHAFDARRVSDGLSLMMWGLFKKVVIADRLAIYVDQVYDHPTAFTGLPLIVATAAFAFQIFCDFSGYSDIAIGAARVMGFRLMTNFDRPYHAASIAEFWKRWHISLSSWFRDYVYIPLGGNRAARPRWYFNLFVTFVLSGFWHGASWTFVIWGALNGLYLLTSLWTQPLRTAVVRVIRLDRAPALHRALQVAITFALTCVAWVFFRANSLADAAWVLTHMLSGPLLPRSLGGQAAAVGRLDFSDFSIALAGILAMELVHLWQARRGARPLILDWPTPARWTLYYAGTLVILFFGQFGHRQFIYFQF